MIYQKMRLEISSLNDFTDILKDSEIVIIFSDLRNVFSKFKEEFVDILIKILDQTNHLKIVLVAGADLKINCNGYQVKECISIGPLKKSDAIRFFLSQDKEDNLLKEEEIKKDELFLKNLSN